MDLTEEEKQIILEKRRQEELAKPIKEGYLKHDLYLLEDFEFRMEHCNHVMTKSERDKLIKEFSDLIELDLPAGSEFNCYLEDGQEVWYDAETGSIAGADAEWAKKHLHKIKVLRKTK